ncbi:MAG: hypothetical protein ACRC33_16895 [Gemmataceae bacterium]
MDYVIRWLAIIGAFALGAALTQWLWHRLAHKWFKDQKLPPWTAWLSRLCGGTIFAVLVYWIAFGGGGAGLGGTGGFFGGSYPSVADSGKQPAKDKDQGKAPEPKEKEKKEPPAAVGSDTIRIEVLGDAPLRKLAGGDKFDRERRYQVKGVPGVQTLDEVKQRLSAMKAGTPPLKRVEVVLYLDSPNRDRPQIAELLAYIRDIDPAIKPDFYEPGRRAPVD